MCNEDNVLYKILLSREKRVEKQRYLTEKYKCSLISFTLNIPGPVKDSALCRGIHQEGMKEIIKSLNSEQLEILYKEKSYEDAGPEGFICVGVGGLELKSITVAIEENHKLGRIFDFDVFDSSCNLISRKSIGLGQRKCLLCNKEALICRRSKEHSIEELLEKIEMMASTWQKQ